MKTHLLALAAPLVAAACSSSGPCPPPTAHPPLAAGFVVTVQDAVTHQPLTAGVSVVTDRGGNVVCVDSAAGTPDPDAGAPPCDVQGWDVFFNENSNTGAGSSREAHTITVSTPGYRTASIPVTAYFMCGDGAYPPPKVVASLQPP